MAMVGSAEPSRTYRRIRNAPTNTALSSGLPATKLFSWADINSSFENPSHRIDQVNNKRYEGFELAISAPQAIGALQEAINEAGGISSAEASEAEMGIYAQQFQAWKSRCELKLNTIDVSGAWFGSFYGAIQFNRFESSSDWQNRSMEITNALYYGAQKLRDFVEKLEVIAKITSSVSQEDQGELFDKTNSPSNNNKIFVVHGHDHQSKLDVARTIEKLGLKAIVLHERPNAGQTIVEKFEANADVGFAVIILAPDDFGKSKEETESKPRARQNVILELGYFMASLKRKNVFVLRVESVEIPSDILGIVYTPMDKHDGWKFKLVGELQKAGFDVSADSLT